MLRPADEEPRFVGGWRGLAYLDGERLLFVEGSDAAGRIIAIRPEGEDPRFVSAENGLFRFEDGRLFPVASAVQTGAITEIRPVNEYPRFVGSHTGLFYINDDGLALVEGSDSTGAVWVIRPDGENPRLIGADNGVFRIDERRVAPFEGGGAARQVTEIPPQDEVPRFVRSFDGLFRISGERLLPVAGSEAAGSIWSILPEGEVPRFVTARNGLFRIEGERLVPVEGGEAVGRVWHITPEGEEPRFVSSSNGLFRVEGERLLPVASGEDFLRVLPWREGFSLAFASTRILAIENGERLVELEGGDATGRIWTVGPESENPLLLGAALGLFQLDEERILPVVGGDVTGRIWGLGAESEEPRLVEAENGLFQILRAIPVAAKQAGPAYVANSTENALRWEVRSQCFAYESSLLFGVSLENEQVVYPAKSFSDFAARMLLVEARVPLNRLDSKTIEATLHYRASQLDSWSEVENSQRVIRVQWTFLDYVRDFLARNSLWIGIGHAVLFLVMLLASRWSNKAWRFLSDPVFNKAFLWFWLAMRHLPFLHRWPLRRWAESLRERLEPSPHVPLPLSSYGRSPLVTIDMVSELCRGRRIWIQGNSGMGKTAVVDLVINRWLEPTNKSWSFARAFRERGYLLVPITLRKYAEVTVPETSEDWLFKLVGLEFARGGVPIDDHQLLRGIVTSGSLILVIDGENEVEDNGAIQQFALRYPEVGLLVTSQNAAPTGYFDAWRLPQTISEAIVPLLDAWLTPDQAQATADAVQRSPIRGDIVSGYDVRLLADLIEGGVSPDDLPRSRIGLYNAILARAVLPDGSAYPVSQLCRISWISWIEGERHLVPGKNISQSLLEPLVVPEVRVIRPSVNGQVEFRHDQMRGYLAARWAAEHEVSPIDLFGETKAIWRLSRSEQQTVWGFFAKLIDSERGPAILEWSTLEAERAELQVALREVANRDGWRTT